MMTHDVDSNDALVAFVCLDDGLVDALNTMSRGGAFRVWYLGDNLGRQQDIQRVLPPAGEMGRCDVTLDQMADDLEECLLTLRDQADLSESQQLCWDVSITSDLSPYNGALQLNAARYFWIERILNSAGRHLFVFEDGETGLAFRRTAEINGLQVEWLGGAYGHSTMMSGLRARASVLKTVWKHQRTMKALRRGADARWDALKECDVLVLDWAGTKTFSPSRPSETSAVLEKMPHVLRESGLKVGFIANPLYWLDPFSDIASNTHDAFDPVVLLDECLPLTTLLYGAWNTWMFSRGHRPAVTCKGRDISPLLHHELQQDICRTQPSRSYAYTAIARTLAQKGVKPKAIVYPFENQGWERALVLGARQHLPDCRMIAYQHCPFSMRMISFFPSRSDRPECRPDQLIVMGSYYADQFEKRGFPKDRLSIGGSLRFENLLSSTTKSAHKESGRWSSTVICCTSIEYSESADLVLKTMQAVRSMDDVGVIVNFHPRVNDESVSLLQQDVAAFDSDWERYVSFSEETATDLFPKVDVVLYNSSGAVFDAVISGLPAVHVAVEGRLNYNKLSGDISFDTETVEDLHRVLKEVLSMPRQERGAASVENYIAPVNEDAIVGAVRGGV